MPLTITLDVLALQKRLLEDIFCTIDYDNAYLMYTFHQINLAQNLRQYDNLAIGKYEVLFINF